MWRGTGIRDKSLAVMLLVWHYAIHSSSYTTFSVALFADYFPPSYSCSNIFLRNCSFLNICISSYYLHSCGSFIFLPWFSSGSISWYVWFCRSNDTLVSLHLLYARSILLCAHIYSKLCRYPCIGIYKEEFFIFSWSSWYWLLVHWVKPHRIFFTDLLNS